MRLAPVMQFLEDDPKGVAIRRTRPVVQSGRQFSSTTRQVAAVQGRLTRALDMCNGSEQKMMSILCRLVAELMLQEYEAATVLKAIRRVEQHSWLKLDRLRALVQSPRSGWQETATMLDRYWKRERNLDYRLRRSEVLTGGERGS